MKRRIGLLLILFFLQMTAAGCWDYIEYENVAQIIGMGFDFDIQNQESTVTQQFLVTKGGKGSENTGGASGKTGIMYSATNGTTFEALAKIQEVMPKRLFYGYLKVVMMGEEAAKYDLKNQMEFLDRSPIVRDTAYFVACSGKSEKVLCTTDENTMTPSSQIIFNLLQNAEATGVAFPTTLHDVIEMLAIGGWEVTVPRVISTVDDASKAEIIETQGNIRIDEKYKGGLRVAGMAAFKGDKFVGWLDEKETIGLGWITGKKIRAYKISAKTEGTDRSEILYFRTLKSSSKIKVKLVNDEPVISVDVSVEADLRKNSSSLGSDFITSEDLTRLKEELANSIRSDIQASLKRGQSELESDIFGFGFAFFREYPSLWRTEYEGKWPDIYPDIPVEVNVKTKVINTGSNIRKLIVK